MTALEEPVRPAAPRVSMRAFLPAGPRRGASAARIGIDATRRGDELAAGAAPGPPHRAGPGRPDSHRLAGGLDRARADSTTRCTSGSSNSFWPLGNSLAFSDSLLGYAPGGLDRARRGGRARPLQPALPVRLLARVRGRLPARAGARPAAARRGGGRDRVRLRALPLDDERASARDLERRHPAVAVSAAARLPQGAPAGRARRLAGGRLAAQPGLHARAAARLPAGRAGGDRGRARGGGAAARRPRARWSTATVAGLALFAVVGAYQARPYLEVSRDHAAARRSIEQVRYYSAPPRRSWPPPRRTGSGRGATAARSQQPALPGRELAVPRRRDRRAGAAGRWPAASTPAGCASASASGCCVCAVLVARPGDRRGAASATGCCSTTRPAGTAVRTPGRIVTLDLARPGAARPGAGAQRVVRGAARRASSRLAVGVALPLVVLAEGSWTLWQAARAAARPRRRSRPALAAAPPSDPPLQRPAVPALVGATASRRSSTA